MLLQECGNCNRTFPETTIMKTCTVRGTNGMLVEVNVCQSCLELIQNSNEAESNLLLG